MSRVLISAFLFVFLGFGFLAGSAAANGHNCDDYEFREDAQAALPNSPTLDGNDNDGKACESLPSRGGGSGSGSVDSGNTGGGSSDGGDADSDDDSDDVSSGDDGDFSKTGSDNVAGLPATGTGPLTSSSEMLVVMLAVSALVSGAVAMHLRLRVR